MKTNLAIKASAKRLFNQKGVKNVTLREVAEQIGKSYGNVTYHFPTKEKLITALYEDMNMELSNLQSISPSDDNLLTYFLSLPDYSYDITLCYLFFYKDYVELKRTYPQFINKVEQANSIRKSKWLELLLLVQKQGYLQKELTINDLEYIMELSTGIRLFYFQEKEWEEFDKDSFRLKVNRLLFPYLSQMGQRVFKKFTPPA